MITCKHLIDWLDDYLARPNCDPAVVAEIEQHMTRCPPCADFWKSYREVARCTLPAERIPVPDDVAARIQATLSRLITEGG